MSDDFSSEQKSYLEGFAAGSNVSGLIQQALPTWASTVGAPDGRKPHGEASLEAAAQERFLAAGKKLSNEEQAKRKIGCGLDIYDEMVRHAQDAKYPKGTDVFLFKFQGMFFVAPAQDSFMCRLRMPNGILTHWQVRGLADIAQDRGTIR